ncbi:glucosamine-6-phosphate deaminase [Adhaeribacter radiodurans]|uniref:Glucosamine-6-phosphate deaminase n=1 Tax=Adhaeribacter radiodurans TaxID=2745197 RepID=A0A7L7L3N0_9BACT|nr:glucosamine-6-phosphate deaminase [Adhaeribacter radiodurans]QMU27380.1 glucosamine-6-phosphate deaminase [Adhaeribacter radiodurans]
MNNESIIDALKVDISATRSELGFKAAKMVASKIIELLSQQQLVNIIFAAAPSQNEFLEELSKNDAIAWERINAFHMDEYVGLQEDAPQRFGNFLKIRLFGKVPFRSVNYLNGLAENIQEECARYTALLESNPTDIVCMGIGENAHIAFNDPHVADFNDPHLVKIVDLDEACRQQQVNDGCFTTLNEVPTYALTLTVPALMRAKYAFCIVPGPTKAQAIHNTLQSDIQELYPSTILRKHPEAILFIDKESSGLL